MVRIFMSIYKRQFFFFQSKENGCEITQQIQKPESYCNDYTCTCCGLEEFVIVPAGKKPNSFALYFHRSLRDCTED